MIFLSIAPSPRLRDVIGDYLIAHFRFDPEKRLPQRAYSPKPEQGITFFLRGRPSLASPLTKAVRKAPPATIFGQQMKRCNVDLPTEFLMFRVHFQPGALFRVVNFPLYEFGEDYFDAELILGRDVREVRERLANSKNYAEMVEVVETYLVRSIARTTQDVLPVDRAAARLTADPRRLSLDWLARQACLSPRHFNRKFTERIGVGPKIYGRLVRYHRAYLFKAAHPAIAWPRVAIECGYTDYQHLVRDFRRFTDATPNAWLKENAEAPENLLTRPGVG
jgi:AraC-like DNA-binding protein